VYLFWYGLVKINRIRQMLDQGKRIH
jgi:hypothetical protein